MKCNKCGKELKDRAKFCTSCGAKIEAEVKDEKTESLVTDGITESNKGSDWAENNKTKTVSKKIWFILSFVVVLAIVVLGGVIYYESNIKDSLKDFEYNSIIFTDSPHDVEFRLYFGEEKMIELYTSDSTPAYSVYPADGKMWCVTGYQFPWECTEVIPDKELFTALLYDIPHLKSKYSDAMTGSLFKDEQIISTENINEICDKVHAFDFNTEWASYDLTRANVEFEGKDLIIVDSNIRIRYTKTERQDVIDTIKQRIKEVYGSGWLTGEYHPSDDGSVNVSIPEDNIYVEDDYTVSMIVNVDGLEKHFPYASCLWSESGCVIDGVEYTMDEEYRKRLELEDELSMARNDLSGTFYMDTGGSSLKEVKFQDVYISDSEILADATVDGTAYTFHVSVDNVFINIAQTGIRTPVIWYVQKGLKTNAVAYHVFQATRGSYWWY